MDIWVKLAVVSLAVIFVIGGILEASAKVFYPSTNYRTQHQPMYCIVQEDVPHTKKDNLMDMATKAVLEWKAKLQAAELTNKALWDMRYKLVDSTSPSCDITIYFKSSVELYDYPDAIGAFLDWAKSIEVAFGGLDDGTIYDTILHEIGHSIGLDHYFSDDDEINLKWITGDNIAPSIMTPLAHDNPALAIITDVDIWKVQQIYGTQGFYAFSPALPPKPTPTPTPVPIPTPKPPIVPVFPLDSIRITHEIIEVKKYEQQFVKIIGDIKEDVFKQGIPVYLIVKHPDDSFQTLKILTTKDGHFETTLVFDGDSTRGIYKVEASYLEHHDREMDFIFYVVDKGTDIESIIPKFVEPLTTPTQTTDDIVFDTFSNPDYGFSIKYPQNWLVHDEVEEYPAVAGYDDGGANLVWFTNESDPLSIWDHYIAISFSKNNVNARNYEGQDYLKTYDISEEEFCKWYIDEGIGCSYSKIDSKIFEIDGRKAYQITEKISYTYSDIPSLDGQTIDIFRDIVDGNNVWNVYSSSNAIEYPKAAAIIEEIINSFSIEGDDTQQLSVASAKLPDWIKNNAKWWAEGTIGDSDFTGGIQHMIKEKIINIPDLPEQASGTAEEKVPSWIRNNAGWWADGLISEDDFIGGIKWLVENGIIKV